MDLLQKPIHTIEINIQMIETRKFSDVFHTIAQQQMRLMLDDENADEGNKTLSKQPLQWVCGQAWQYCSSGLIFSINTANSKLWLNYLVTNSTLSNATTSRVNNAKSNFSSFCYDIFHHFNLFFWFEFQSLSQDRFSKRLKKSIFMLLMNLNFSIVLLIKKCKHFYIYVWHCVGINNLVLNKFGFFIQLELLVKFVNHFFKFELN